MVQARSVYIVHYFVMIYLHDLHEIDKHRENLPLHGVFMRPRIVAVHGIENQTSREDNTVYFLEDEDSASARFEAINFSRK